MRMMGQMTRHVVVVVGWLPMSAREIWQQEPYWAHGLPRPLG